MERVGWVGWVEAGKGANELGWKLSVCGIVFQKVSWAPNVVLRLGVGLEYQLET